MQLHFTDAQEMAKKYPVTFEAPTQEELDGIRPGHHVKVCINDCERIWIEVTSVALDFITGTIDNDPVRIPAKYGDTVTFEKRHVYSTHVPDIPPPFSMS